MKRCFLTRVIATIAALLPSEPRSTCFSGQLHQLRPIKIFLQKECVGRSLWARQSCLSEAVGHSPSLLKENA
jgi:hypothetical protein